MPINQFTVKVHSHCGAKHMNTGSVFLCCRTYWWRRRFSRSTAPFDYLADSFLFILVKVDCMWMCDMVHKLFYSQFRGALSSSYMGYPITHSASKLAPQPLENKDDVPPYRAPPVLTIKEVLFSSVPFLPHLPPDRRTPSSFLSLLLASSVTYSVPHLVPPSPVF
jgi:hypothetical protein